jgi:hypothetical protein
MAMQIVALGPVTTVTAGTPVQVSPALVALFPDPKTDVNHNVHAVVFAAVPSNTGKVYIGTKGMNKGTLVGVLMVLMVPTTNLLPTFSISLTLGANAVSLDDLYIDSDTSGQGALVSALIA